VCEVELLLSGMQRRRDSLCQVALQMCYPLLLLLHPIHLFPSLTHGFGSWRSGMSCASCRRIHGKLKPSKNPQLRKNSRVN
jgi:hypothetical protein